MAISLASIAKTQRASKPPLVAIHGPEKVGKTTLGASAYRPIFMPFEDGLGGITGVDAFPVLKSWQDCKDAFSVLLTEQHEFSTLVIDSIDWLEPHIWMQVATDHDKKTIEDIGYGKGYLDANTYWREFLNLCKQVRDDRSMAVILIAHSEVKKFEPPDSDPYELFQMKLHKQANPLIYEWADVIGFASDEVKLKKTDAGFGKKKAQGVSTGRRFLYVGNNPAYKAGNRFGMPDKIDLTWQALVDAIQGSQQTQPQQQTA